jgi:hypothetical protein
MRATTRFLALLPLLAIMFVPASVAPAAAQATIVINNIDDADQGFNDPTPAAPVGGNPGTTVGQLRLNVFQRAAEIWGATLDSDVTIIVQSTFQDRGFTPCTANSAVLGAAGTIQIFANFPNAQWPNTWYHSALSNKLANVDLTPFPPDPGFLVEPFGDDIIAFFNPNLGQANCFAGPGWYYGLDNNAPAGATDLLNVVLHELSHGLGFANFIDEDGEPGVPPGSGPLGLPDIYTVFSRDNTEGKQWNQMDDRERARSAANTGNLVWNGPQVVADAPGILDFARLVRITAPANLAGTNLEYGTSSFAPVPDLGTFNGNVVLVDDGTAPTSDACTSPLVNAAAVAGNIALIDRGTCAFAFKAAVAQLAGATGVMIANNVAGQGAIGLGGAPVIPMTIPVIGISKEDGDLIKANLPGVAIGTFPSTNRAGLDSAGNVRLYAPGVVAPGSSVSHWDTVALPNLLMEPFINTDLEGATTLDLTPSLMTDIGWTGGPYCPVGSDVSSPTVVVNGCDSGVPNRFGPWTVFPNPSGTTYSGLVAGGCTISDVVNSCPADAKNHGDAVSCVTHVTTALAGAGALSDAERTAILTCAAGTQ